MPKLQLEHKKMSLTFKILKALFIIFLLISFAPEAICSQSHIEKKRRETHAKVLRFKRLESIETNKLYKNQQRLEHAQKSLTSTKKQYKNAEEQLAEAEKNLNETMQEYSASEFQAKNRVRQIYKKRRYAQRHNLLSK